MIDRKKLETAVKFIREHTKFRPRIALILGSGLGDFADQLDVVASIPTNDIPHYPRSTVQGHEGRLIFGYIRVSKQRSAPLLVFKGRVHFYETGDLPPVAFPVQLASTLDAKSLFVTNAAGGINRGFKAGDLMLIRDVLDLTFTKSNSKVIISNSKSQKIHPLEWPLGATNALFDSKMMRAVSNASEKLGLQIHEGTYCWLKGPTYETAAEIEMLRRIGADAVGMSTVPEIFTANQLGMKVAGISLISNMATGITGEKLTHSEVTQTGNRIKKSFTALMKRLLLNL